MSETDFDAFSSCRGDAFSVSLGQDQLSLELSTVDPLPETPGRPQPFSLVFSGPVEPPLQQMIYRMSHARLGELDVFLVPVQRLAETIRYEAIFN